MYITEVLTKTKKGKISHRCCLLRESYRENGKVKNRTLANLSHCKPNEIEAMKLALKHKNDLSIFEINKGPVEIHQGLSFGAVFLVYNIAKQLGIEKILGASRAGKLALWQVIARVIDQGSRLSSVRLAGTHDACSILNITETFNEDHLYENLAWLAKEQKQIENKLYELRCQVKKSELFLYDVTSSYFEGSQNALADWGYNRDKKSGKKQVVVGLLCDDMGDPLSIEVFNGNTNDLNTFNNQIEKSVKRFGCEKVTFVGDRGMIKSGQMHQLKTVGFNYITAITKAQIDKMIKENIIQLELFSSDLFEVKVDNVRYVLKRNPVRANEIELVRKEKKESISKYCEKINTYLAEHTKAGVSVAIKKVIEKIEKLKVNQWLNVEAENRVLKLITNEKALEDESKLDGCYVIQSDLPDQIDKKTIHERYKDLAKVEQGFRICKTVMLEIRPWYVRSENSTRGHALVVMLAYLIVRYLKNIWASFDLTVEEAINQLASLCSVTVNLQNNCAFDSIPTPRKDVKNLLKAANVRLPKVFPKSSVKVVSRKRLQNERNVS